jgi:hypothetical protein
MTMQGKEREGTGAEKKGHGKEGKTSRKGEV